MNKYLFDKLPRLDKIQYSIEYLFLVVMLIFLCILLLTISVLGLYFTSKDLILFAGILAIMDLYFLIWGFNELFNGYDKLNKQYLSKFKYGGK
jgi:hypothetical protein